mmetsp:Transcript_5293/g.11386  ORF Transcript_5293/g.11386 Transcript_5293/m.11386 type:complete len:241 (-) Transcript_5293:93-815(-)
MTLPAVSSTDGLIMIQRKPKCYPHAVVSRWLTPSHSRERANDPVSRTHAAVRSTDHTFEATDLSTRNQRTAVKSAHNALVQNGICWSVCTVLMHKCMQCLTEAAIHLALWIGGDCRERSARCRLRFGHFREGGGRGCSGTASCEHDGALCFERSVCGREGCNGWCNGCRDGARTANRQGQDAHNATTSTVMLSIDPRFDASSHSVRAASRQSRALATELPHICSSTTSHSPSEARTMYSS